MRVTTFVTSWLFVLISACAATPQLAYEERAYLERVKIAPLKFTIAESDINWVRSEALRFVSAVGDGGLVVATDFAIANPRPTQEKFAYGYEVLISPTNDGYSVTVACHATRGRLSSKYRHGNAKILAHFLKTGELKQRFLRR